MKKLTLALLACLCLQAQDPRGFIRGTLSAWELRLAGQGFVRIHRSRLVNRTHVGALEPTGSGDFEVTLTNGRKLQGSRRFRSDLG